MTRTNAGHTGLKYKIKVINSGWFKKGEKRKCKILRGEEHGSWVGDKVGYQGVHVWIRKKYGKANKCEDKSCSNKSNYFDWHNINGKYKRNINDWKMLCRSCHRKLDQLGRK